ncbi:MAG: sulfatase [Verrucomicrobiales bacterium]|nr:sulfatase [Verrucomicrobiales bacterium]
MQLLKKALVLTLACLACASTQAAQKGKPNILFIVGDDMGYSDVGFQGCKDIPTPNLDKLAASGVRFTSGYVSAPYCSPSRAGMLTGRYQEKFGHEFNPSSPGSGLPTNQVTIADRLKKVGYHTGLVGKWHEGNEAWFHPQKRGFDEFFGFLGGSHSYLKWNGMLRGTEPVSGEEYFTDAFGREASSYIEKNKNEPWFLYLAFNAVHTPMDATEDRIKLFAKIDDTKRRTYAAMMYAMDQNIGRVLAKLEETGQAENTYVIFFADNGGPVMPGTTMNASHNDPLRGGKRTTLEGGIRVPFIVSWKNHLKPAVYDNMAFTLDMTATALKIAGADTKNLDGVNLMPYVTGKNNGQPHDVLYWRFGDQMAIRIGDYKLVRYDQNADLKVGRKLPAVGPFLYNLKTDIGETKDLSKEMPDKLHELQAKWDQWNKTLAKPAWGYGKGDSDGDPKQPKKKKKKDAPSV